MKFNIKALIILCIVLTMIACASPENTVATQTPIAAIEITPTPDPCLAPALSDQVGKVNKFMREFDDYSTLASNTPQTQLVVIIPELQRVLREAEDQIVPACLLSLKKLQLEHMQTVVQTLLAFIGNSDPNFINTNIAKARDLHQQYDIELARLLGITLQVATPGLTAAVTVSQTAPPTPIITNPGPNEINLWTAPDFNAPVSNVLPAQATAIALGRTADNQWIQVETPNQPGVLAWVIASVVQLNVPIGQLPITAP